MQRHAASPSRFSDASTGSGSASNELASFTLANGGFSFIPAASICKIASNLLETVYGRFGRGFRARVLSLLVIVLGGRFPVSRCLSGQPSTSSLLQLDHGHPAGSLRVT